MIQATVTAVVTPPVAGEVIVVAPMIYLMVAILIVLNAGAQDTGLANVRLVEQVVEDFLLALDLAEVVVVVLAEIDSLMETAMVIVTWKIGMMEAVMETGPVLMERKAAGIAAAVAVAIAMQVTVTRLLAIAFLVIGMATGPTDPYTMDTVKNGALTGTVVHAVVAATGMVLEDQDTMAAVAAAIVRGRDHMIDPAKVGARPMMTAIDI